jgi:hypothetical protein
MQLEADLKLQVDTLNKKATCAGQLCGCGFD